MKSVVLIALLALALPVAAAGERARTAETVIAVEGGPRYDTLVRLDAQTLRPTGARLALRDRLSRAYAFSPDRRRVAIPSVSARGLRVFDVATLKRAGRVRLADPYLREHAWLGPRRIVGFGQQGVFAVDPVSGKALRAPAVPPEIVDVRPIGSRLVFLFARPRWTIGTARLMVVEAGRTREVRLARIRAGVLEPGGSENYEPALALDAASRAFVVGGRDEPVGEVNLRTLRVRYHELPKLPQAVAGRTRRAIWLGGGRIAVWGRDVLKRVDRFEYVRTGLQIVDLRERRYEVVDPDAQSVSFTAGTLLVSGTGLRGYSPGGRRLYETFQGEHVSTPATFRTRAWVFAHLGSPRLRMIDARTGAVLGTPRSIPFILHSDYKRG